MKTSDIVSLCKDSQYIKRSRFCGVLRAGFCLFLIYFFASFLIVPSYRENLPFRRVEYKETVENIKANKCKTECRTYGSEALPEGIVSRTSNFELRPLWGIPKKKIESDQINLFAAAVGMKQKHIVNKMVRKFLASNFIIILFHYDGNVDKWKSLDWSDRAIHISAMNQTKWWFAKRFLHPDIVAKYSYIFLWDEDLGVEYFDPTRYVSIIQSEGLEISQPALDLAKSREIHHLITVRGRRSTVHRRIYHKDCDGNSKGPPCTGWIEMMAPVFSRAAWRCVWHMIQNDMIHAWGLDMKLGYCAQGDRTKNVGVVDTEYVIHLGLPTLGGVDKETSSSAKNQTSRENVNSTEISNSNSLPMDHRLDVRKQSYSELEFFKNRWKRAVKEDKCWVDPYQ